MKAFYELVLSINTYSTIGQFPPWNDVYIDPRLCRGEEEFSSQPSQSEHVIRGKDWAVMNYMLQNYYYVMMSWQL